MSPCPRVTVSHGFIIDLISSFRDGIQSGVCLLEWGGTAVEVKGTAIITIPLFVKERFGEGGLNRWIDVLTPEVRDVYPVSVLVSPWYPLKEFLGVRSGVGPR